MNINEPEVAFWEHHECILPSRTRLYRLEPLGMGSELVESLTSLIHRLAGAHSLSTRQLVVREIVPFLRRQTVCQSDGHCDLLCRFGAALNGNNETAAEIVSVIERLTGLSGLSCLTMRLCGENVAKAPLIRLRQAWCPECFTTWRKEGTELYNPLIWSLSAVRFCPRHAARLHDTCLGCGKRHWPLQGRAKAGYCPHCGKWLGASMSPPDSGASPSRLEQSPWDVFAAEESARFLSWLQSPSCPGLVSRFGQNVRCLIEQSSDKSVAEFGRSVSAHPKTIGEWIHGTQRPSLYSLLLLSSAVGVGVQQLLFEDIRELGASLSRVPRRRIHSTRSTPRRHDLSGVERMLRAALDPESFPPRSVASIARETGCHQSYIARKLPEFAQAVSLRYRRHAAMRKAERIHYLRTVVRITVEDLHAMGVFPGKTIVDRLLPKGMSLRERAAEAERVETMRRLGLL